jgi:hypothetical protein
VYVVDITGNCSEGLAPIASSQSVQKSDYSIETVSTKNLILRRSAND